MVKTVLLLLLSFGNYAFCERYAPFFDIQAPQKVYAPATVEELQRLINKARSQGRKICIVGAGKSQGGQTVAGDAHAYRISLHAMNKVVALNVPQKEITVQTGMSWRRLQEFIAPHGLAVKAMQSYNDFSIGGSLAVNVHGQDLASGQLINTVKSFKLITSDGTIVLVSRTENSELFGLALGGYGLFGIVVEVTLQLTNDVWLNRNVEIVSTANFVNHFERHIKNNKSIEFYSARFSIGPKDFMKKAFVITYAQASSEKPAPFALARPHNSLLQRKFAEGVGKSSWVRAQRFNLEKLLLEDEEQLSRNNYLNYTIAGLVQDTSREQYILQEYFVPYAQFNRFINKFRRLVKLYNIRVMNVTARHVHQDTESMLSFAPRTDMCALVLYIQVPKKEVAYATMVQWTQRVIDEALRCNGTYYLPYQLLATQQQFEAAYPSWSLFKQLKKKYDPYGLFTNKLYERYA